ncbi:DUF3859 domain-containing protein [Echinimonas agarilytica]|uniref:DUF3859 domain-containing protein n=1 Tax=Echinimonas agarilytica TaxID=1215918 RepID=A0AA42B7I7_9GAMM|nr:DUF3859 domain-containing protein [Echinimonas agarilytica]MCM2679373.1 DUF3859 domain-containing protein [Echinimonas agarilytica]
MAKSKYSARVVCVGIYDGWDETSKKLPQIKEYTRHIIAEIDVEFGLIINIKKAKGRLIQWCIDHPSIPDEEGEVMAPFEGSEHVTDNDWTFYLGDTIWAPVDNKGGNWRMTIELDGDVIADETFDVEVDEYNVLQDDSFWLGRRRR